MTCWSQQYSKKWSRATYARKTRPITLPRPYAEFIEDAVAVARFAERYWEAAYSSSGIEIRPGLRTLSGAGGFSQRTSEEIRELCESLLVAQNDYLLEDGEFSSSALEARNCFAPGCSSA